MSKGTIKPIIRTKAKSVGFCIYCGERSGLETEHVVPYFLAGGLELPESSCAECAKITKTFEGTLSYHMLFALRRRFDVQSRSKGGNKTHPLIVFEDGAEVVKQVPFENLPPLAPWPVFAPPGILTNAAPTNMARGLGLHVAQIGTAVGKYEEGRLRIKAHLNLFMRMLAKIALGTFHANSTSLGSGWTPILGEVVRYGHFLPFYVGGTTPNAAWTLGNLKTNPPPEEGALPLHEIFGYETTAEGDTVNEYLITAIRPFVPGGSPMYQVVTAKRVSAALLANQNRTSIRLPKQPKKAYLDQGAFFNISTART